MMPGMDAVILPRLLTAADVADWLCLRTRQVERMARRREIPAVTLPGGELVFDAADLDDWLRGRKAAAGEVRHAQ
jgi:excisionase family DNA binding protein